MKELHVFHKERKDIIPVTFREARGGREALLIITELEIGRKVIWIPQSMNIHAAINLTV